MKSQRKKEYVGIFWIDLMSKTGPQIYAIRISLKDADRYGKFNIYPRSHYEEWYKIQKMNHRWKGMEYEDIPRGRVAYDRECKKFLVLLGRKFKEEKAVLDRIILEFALSRNQIIWDFDDEHYQETEWQK